MNKEIVICADTQQRLASLHARIAQTAQTTIEIALEIGSILISEKEGLAHGEWLPWLKVHAPFGERAARNYMRIARSEAEIKSARVPFLKDAFKLLSECGEPEQTAPKPKAETPAPTEPASDEIEAAREAEDQPEPRVESMSFDTELWEIDRKIRMCSRFFPRERKRLLEALKKLSAAIEAEKAAVTTGGATA